MPAVHETKKDSPLEALVERLNELTRQLPRSTRLRPMTEPASPPVGGLEGQPQPMSPPERELLGELVATVKRIEAAQTQGAAELPREIARTIGRETPAQGAALSDDSLQKLRVALGAETRGNAERRILAELAEIKAKLADRAAKPTTNWRRSGVLLALGLAIILFVAGLMAGVLMAPYLTSRLPMLSDVIFGARS
jgi:hypothetical protein